MFRTLISKPYLDNKTNKYLVVTRVYKENGEIEKETVIKKSSLKEAVEYYKSLLVKQKAESKKKALSLRKEKVIGNRGKIGKFGNIGEMNKMIIMKRRAEIMNLMLEGYQFTLFLKDELAKKYNCTRNSINQDVEWIEAQFSKLSIDSLEELLITHFSRYDELYRKFREIGSDFYAIKTLQKKEALALDNEETYLLVINNMNEDSEVNNDEPLSIKQKNRIKTILNKAKKVEIKKKKIKKK